MILILELHRNLLTGEALLQVLLEHRVAQPVHRLAGNNNVVPQHGLDLGVARPDGAGCQLER
eukprot:CAMPEP_0179157538 /NCGR_PEP_ID=MMETSP0796-20121207/76841_1 /TAXON_ID=73915 /ORGANISM="Pyrodinium bahamense, Strain pbaha01" /LENGTH=61 /DNA_ID=CAMNT_0020859171 /DNA_START=276 /DNA_END=457 /DNA_ORIENTATION=-